MTEVVNTVHNTVRSALSGRTPIFIPRMHTSFANLAVRVANAGGSFAFVVAYVLFVLMFLLMLADTILTIVRAW
jgi:hypothetical protein